MQNKLERNQTINQSSDQEEGEGGKEVINITPATRAREKTQRGKTNRRTNKLVIQ